jgi:benzoyl-CoA-dihydrodiol lyase
VLPGTGGLTRVTDKRHVRHDLADIFCTSVEGVRGQKAVDWRLVDAVAKPAVFKEAVQARAVKLAATSKRPVGAKGVTLTPLNRSIAADSLSYTHVSVEIDRAKRIATFTVKAPAAAPASDIAGIEAAGVNWWPLQMVRELDDAILHMRTNELDMGTWILKTSGDAAHVLAADAALLAHKDHWFVRETIGHLRRTLARMDVTSRSLFALVEEGSCFVGTLAELAFCADRTYMLALPDDADKAPKMQLSEMNFGFFPMVNDQDDIDWGDEIRLALEERSAMSPDALTGLEANLRFAQKENMATRIFGRLTAWQNWIFQRPNAVGEKGALKVYGKGEKVQFDMNRV